MATRTISNAGGNYNTTGAWVEGAVPVATDDVVATATSGNLNITATAACRTVDLTGYVGTLTHTPGIVWSVGNSTGGSFKFVPTMTYVATATNCIISFKCTAAGTFNLDSGGITMGSWQFATGAALSTIYQFVSDVTFGFGLSVASGSATVKLNDKNITAQFFTWTTGTYTLNFGTGTLTINGTTASGPAYGSSLTVLNSASFNTVITGSNKSFTGRNTNTVWGNLTLAFAGQVTISGNNTFGTFTNITPGSTTVITNGSTQIATSFVLAGAAGNLVTLITNSAGSSATLSQASGIISGSYLSIKDSVATGGASFYAGSTSVNVSGNTGWIFTNPPSGGGTARAAMLLMGVG